MGKALASAVGTMTAAADRIFTNAVVHTLTGDDETAEAVAVRDGAIVRVGSAYEVGFLEGVETDVVDCDGGVLVPGFVDAHTHLQVVGRLAVDADLTDAGGVEDCVAALREAAHAREEWILGFGYDESGWADPRYLTRSDLDAVSEDRPVAAVREDMHVVSLNVEALARLEGEMPAEDVHTEDGEATGVVVEDAASAVWEAIAPSPSEARELVLAAQERANALGVTTVHEMVRRPAFARTYRDLDREGRLTLRVRLNYLTDLFSAVQETGLRTDHGSGFVRMGAIKHFADGSLGGRTARLSAPYADDPDTTGQWLTDPDTLRDRLGTVDEAALQAAVHAIGDEAIATVLDGLGEADSSARHRVEHAEVLTDDLLERLGTAGVVVSAQPNFLKWAREDGLYDARLGVERSRDTNRYADLLDAGARLAFGSDCMPLDPLYGVQQAVTAPADGQRLSVTEALRAYTSGGAYAGFDEDRLGTVEAGKRADLVVLADSPWSVPPDAIADVDVESTVLDGEIVYEAT
jgi:predicted amidohydrolase YtcJ